MAKARRGFGAMTPERRKELASQGGKAPHKRRFGFHTIDPDKLQEISRKGGKRSKRSSKTAVT